MDNCFMCQGRGTGTFDMGFGPEHQDCPHCEGAGQLPDVAEADLPEWACLDCDGDGYFTKASAMFAGVTFKANCQACKGRGVKPVETRRRIAA